MRILILNSDYPGFLERLYGERPELERQDYAAQLQARHEALFGESDNYATALRKLGAEAWEVHVNNLPLQKAWASENGLPLLPQTALRELRERIRRKLFGKRLAPALLHILAAQVAGFRPDVILNKDMFLLPAGVLRRLSGRNAMIVGQIAAPLPNPQKLIGYDLLVSSLPNLVLKFRSMGLAAELCRLSFDPRLLDAVKPRENRYGVVFVGSLTGDHGKRRECLEYLSRNLDTFEIWGVGYERLPANSACRQRYKGEAWGKEMYEILARAQIALNIHIDIAERHANNFRLFEATGMGALLVTDGALDLHEIFEPDREAIAYDTKEECLARIQEMLADPARLLSIARAGHEKTIKVHNIDRRMAELLDIFSRYQRKPK